MPKSVPHLVLDTVRFVCSDLRYSTPILCPKLQLYRRPRHFQSVQVSQCSTYKNIDNHRDSGSVHLCSAPTLYCYACKNFSKVGRYACTQLYEIDPWGQFLDRKVEWLRPSPNNCATNSCEIVGRWRTATFDRANSMNVAEQKSYKKSTPGYSKLSHNFFARPINIEIRAEQMSN